MVESRPGGRSGSTDFMDEGTSNISPPLRVSIHFFSTGLHFRVLSYFYHDIVSDYTSLCYVFPNTPCSHLVHQSTPNSTLDFPSLRTYVRFCLFVCLFFFLRDLSLWTTCFRDLRLSTRTYSGLVSRPDLVSLQPSPSRSDRPLLEVRSVHFPRVVLGFPGASGPTPWTYRLHVTLPSNTLY